MRKATRISALVFGLTAGAAGIEHGIFEILQGNARPEDLMISSIGPPCVPELSWNQCEPAMTIIPSFLITGILAVILGLVVLAWSAFFLQRRHGGLILILLCSPLLLFGGGAGLFFTYRTVAREMEVSQMKTEFVSSVSHEFRTPLSAIEALLERLESGKVQNEEMRHRYYQASRREVQRLTAMVNQLLDFSRLKEGREEFSFESSTCIPFAF